MKGTRVPNYSEILRGKTRETTPYNQMIELKNNGSINTTLVEIAIISHILLRNKTVNNIILEDGTYSPSTIDLAWLYQS